MRLLVIASAIIGTSFAASAAAGCFSDNLTTRMSAFCLTERSQGESLSVLDARVIDFALKREGYEQGIGFPGSVESTAAGLQIKPELQYHPNINAGNPDTPLVVGDLEFTGDPEKIRKSGVLLGLRLSAYGRHIYGPGRYLELGAGLSHNYSPEHQITLVRSFVSACSKNHVRAHWYLDICGSSIAQRRELASDRESEFAVSASRIIEASGQGVHNIKIGLERFFDNGEYAQNRGRLEWSFLSRGDTFVGMDFVVGEPVDGKLTLQNGGQIVLGTTLGERSVTGSVEVARYTGGALLGVEREDDLVTASISYELSENISVVASYQYRDSSIAYFNERDVYIGAEFDAWRF